VCRCRCQSQYQQQCHEVSGSSAMKNRHGSNRTPADSARLWQAERRSANCLWMLHADLFRARAFLQFEKMRRIWREIFPARRIRGGRSSQIQLYLTEVTSSNSNLLLPLRNRKFTISNDSSFFSSQTGERHSPHSIGDWSPS
jgi:hypothetical protein